MKTRGVTVAEFPWEDYVQAITSPFSNAMFEDAMEEIVSLTQIGSLKEYNSSFDSLLNKVSICEAYAVSLYLKGLKPEIKGPVKMFKPQTLHKAYGLPRIQDINNKNLINQLTGLEDGSRIVKSGNESEKITPPVNAAKLSLLPDPTGVPGPPAYKPATINAKRLSGEELELRGEYCYVSYLFYILVLLLLLSQGIRMLFWFSLGVSCVSVLFI
ncbi:hypothetical protein HanRHA438_Chr09g0417831 [Helianthus annuus]|nr:hypothetical protein HanRHA438_Chr09g0417831 [Helianthus annuus]